MTKNIEGATADIGADLAALRRDVAHMAEAVLGLLERQTQEVSLRFFDAVPDAMHKIASVTEDAQKRVRAAQLRPVSSKIR
jgi:hypothetical protein